MTTVSDSYRRFLDEAPGQAAAWQQGISGLAAASALAPKTEALAYVALLAATRLLSGLPFHVAEAKRHGASRDEIISTVLLGLPAAGNAVTQALAPALDAYDAA